MPPFVVHVESPFAVVADGIERLYGDHALADSGQFADLHIAIRPNRRLYRATCILDADSIQPFAPLSRAEAFALFEWGLNWCVSSQQHAYLILHAAVLANQDNDAIILPAPPGSGKSTLCASLMLDGWRLLSDELTLIDTSSGLIQGFPRPVSLKNASIDLIRQRATDAVFGPEARNTVKGTIRHLKAPTMALAQAHVPARPRWVVFPKYRAGAATVRTPVGKATGLTRLAQNAFNYSLMRERGFHALAHMAECCDFMDFEYSQIDEALEVFSGLHDDAR